MKKTAVLLLIFLFILSGCAANKDSPVSVVDSSQHIASLDVFDSLKFVPVSIEDVDDTGYLVLVNLQNPIAAEVDDSTFAQVLACVPTSPAGIRDMYLHPSALAAFVEMFNCARDADVGRLSVASGFRGYDKQKELYNDGKNDGYVLAPGYSEHQTGLALDIGVQMLSGTDFGKSKQGRWVAENSYRFGLILRYSASAESITGVKYEPWHFRYVGAEHAYYMKQNNLVFEEYIKLLQDKGPIHFEKDGVSYYVFLKCLKMI